MSSLEYGHNNKDDENSVCEIMNVSEDSGTEVKDREEHDGGYFEAIMEHNTEESDESIDSFVRRTAKENEERIRSEKRQEETKESLVIDACVYGSEDSSCNTNEDIVKDLKVTHTASGVMFGNLGVGLKLNESDKGEKDVMASGDDLIADEENDDVTSEEIDGGAMAGKKNENALEGREIDDVVAGEEMDDVVAGEEMDDDGSEESDDMAGEETEDDGVEGEETDDGVAGEETDDMMAGEETDDDRMASEGMKDEAVPGEEMDYVDASEEAEGNVLAGEDTDDDATFEENEDIASERKEIVTDKENLDIAGEEMEDMFDDVKEDMESKEKEYVLETMKDVTDHAKEYEVEDNMLYGENDNVARKEKEDASGGVKDKTACEELDDDLTGEDKEDSALADKKRCDK